MVDIFQIARALSGDIPLHNPTARQIQRMTDEQCLAEWERIVKKESSFSYRQREFIRYRVAFIRSGKVHTNAIDFEDIKEEKTEQ
jgi:hypothetical protein